MNGTPAAAPAPLRPRIDRAAARRIDRLAFLAHLFHRYAHHPLCVGYAHELIPLGRRARICKGCALALLGAAAGVITSVFYRIATAHLVELSLALSASSLAWCLSRRRRMRASSAPGVGAAARANAGAWASKVTTRFVPALLGAFAIFSGARQAWLAALLTLFAAGLVVATYRRFGPSRAPCDACPELRSRPDCRGYRPIWRRERAFARKAGALLESRS